jgi:hypothetical protein
LIRGHFKLDGRHIAQAGMQPLGIVDILNTLSDGALRLLKALILFEVDLLLFEGFEKTGPKASSPR